MTASPWVVTVTAPVTFPGPEVPPCAMYYSVPEHWYGTVPGAAGEFLRADVAGRELRDLAYEGAARAGRVLHHADWVITADPAQVEALSAPGRDDCADCAADLADILGWMGEHPGREMAVALLWWLAELPATVRSPEDAARRTARGSTCGPGASTSSPR